MKRLVLLLSFIILSSQTTWADVKSSLLALTGNARTKAVWVRWPWCDNSYTPVQAYKTTYYENDHNFTQLVVFDTDEGTERMLDATVRNHCFPKLTRRDGGGHVIWNDNQNKCAWIQGFAGTAAATKLVTNVNGYYVLALSYNPVSDSEYVYILGGYDGHWVGMTLDRYPLKPDYSGIVTTAKLTIATAGSLDDGMDWHAAASEDGKYVGLMNPQPEGAMVQVGTGTVIPRHYVNGQDGGCQPNIAPDNSYRFFHLTDAHMEIAMFPAGTVPTAQGWLLDIATPLDKNTSHSDVNQPRWTNNVQFITAAYPLATGLVSGAKLFGMTAAQVQAADASTAGSFCIAKFSADFKSLAGSVRVSDGDVRHRDAVGDAWIQPPGWVSVDSRASHEVRQTGLDMQRIGNLVTVRADGRIEMTVTNAQGRLVSTVAGPDIALDTRTLKPGVYVIAATSETGYASKRLTISR